MFFKLDNKHIVNLDDVSYVSVDYVSNHFELKIFLKQVEHYMFLTFDSEEEAMEIFVRMMEKLNVQF